MYFTTRKPDGTGAGYNWGVNVLDTWVFVVDTFDLATRVGKGYLNGVLQYSATIPSNEKTILEWDPDTATYPFLYKRFVIGASSWFIERVNEVVDEVCIYSRALSDDEILWNYNYPYNPIRNGLVLWLPGTDEAIQPPTWYDKSNFGNNGTIYGAQKTQLIRKPARTLAATRVLASAR
jgi:hypothetical protein